MLRSCVDGAFQFAGIGRIEQPLPLLNDRASDAVVPHFRGEQGYAAVMMLVVVPGKELLAKGACVLDAAEAFRKLRPVLKGFELALRVRVVVRHVRATMG
jgi:hypothetical protein